MVTRDWGIGLGGFAMAAGPTPPGPLPHTQRTFPTPHNSPPLELTNAMSLVPLRYISSPPDLLGFQGGRVYEDLLLFISSLKGAVRGKPLSAPCPTSPFMEHLLGVLATLEGWMGDHPPLQQPMRFGNKAFRGWFAKVVGESVGLCTGLLQACPTAAAPSAGAALEVATYLCESFGNPTRIDYGTGHECAFLFFLCALGKAGALSPEDLPCLGLRVIPAYLRVCRALQRRYGLEPAGSHGVWCLDDYHFLVFILGSSQLVGHPFIRPRDALAPEAREESGKDYLYLDAITFISEVKRGAPFEEHSPVLAGLADLPSWARVNEELAKKYKVEVLGKLPVAQHFCFGTLLPATWAPTREPTPSDTGLSILECVRGEGEKEEEGRPSHLPSKAGPASPSAAPHRPFARVPTATDLANDGTMHSLPMMIPRTPTASDLSSTTLPPPAPLQRSPTATDLEAEAAAALSAESPPPAPKPISRTPTATELTSSPES